MGVFIGVSMRVSKEDQKRVLIGSSKNYKFREGSVKSPDLISTVRNLENLFSILKNSSKDLKKVKG
jgi:hypothetical protein